MKPLHPLLLLSLAIPLLAQTNKPVAPAATPSRAPAISLPAVAVPSFAPDALVPAPSVTNFWDAQLRSSRRIISGRAVDITPLVRWYQRPSGGRPLTAWQLVTGRITGQNSYGWVVVGYLDSQPQSRPFTIQNPPLEARNEFNRLKGQFNQLLRREEALKSAVEQAQDLFDQTSASYQRFGYIRFGGDLLDQRQGELNRARADLARTSSEIQLFDAAGQDLRGEYTVRCFVVKTGTAFNGTVVYDHGYITR